MSMTKKDYEAIATIIKQSQPAERENPTGYDMSWASGCAAACERIATNLADHCGRENPQFKRDRFLKACGVAE